MIKVILWDLENTLLNFQVAEKKAIISTFDKMNLGKCTQAMFNRFVKINDMYWQKIQRSDIDKELALIKRYEDFFTEYGINKELATEFNDNYSLSLADTIVYNDHCIKLLNEFKNKYKQYIVSNEVKSIEQSRLKASGIDEIVDGCFISDDIGYEKPNKGFFDYVLEHIDKVNKQEIMIVGDSLESDIRGGNLAGIKTCWYNPKNKDYSHLYKVDLEVQNLNEIASVFNLIESQKI